MGISRQPSMRRRWAVIAAAAAVLLVPAPAEAGDRKAGDVFRDCDACPEMVVVPAGTYVMGEDKRHRYEKPAHEVTIAKPFAIGRFELTFDEWEACHADGACEKNPDDHKWGRGRRPVMNISWFDARQYLGWISKKTGHTYRLPTEAEWEYAARAGTRTAYSWGEEPGKTNANCRTCAPHISHKTYPVGKYEPNPWGLYDVHGNVWEWVEDCWHKSHAGAPADGSARSDGKCRYRVTRSGSWYYVSTNVRSGYRAKFIARAYSYGIGLRPLRELP
jgi:formylglycine-generating enzyme required for sulfatase activity